MRHYLIVIIIIILGCMGLYKFLGAPETYTAPEIITNTVVEEVERDPTDVLVKQAIAASSTAIQAAAQEAFEATVDRLEKQIELSVRKEQRIVDDEIITKLEDEVSF